MRFKTVLAAAALLALLSSCKKREGFPAAEVAPPQESLPSTSEKAPTGASVQPATLPPAAQQRDSSKRKP